MECLYGGGSRNETTPIRLWEIGEERKREICNAVIQLNSISLSEKSFINITESENFTRMQLNGTLKKRKMKMNNEKT